MRWDIFCIRLRKLWAIAANGSYRQAFLSHRIAPAIEHAAVLGSLAFDFVADVGANRGQFSLLCRRLRPGARIAAFEPLEGPADVYRAVFEGDAGVTLHPVALGPQRGQMEMNISQRDDSSSLLPISKVQTENFPGTERVAVRSVTIAPLTDFVRADDLGGRNLLKIDVQGFELEVLKSAGALLPRFDWIYAECSYVPLYENQALADEIIAFLAAQGFTLSGRYNASHGRSGRELLQADLLFTRNAS